MRPLLRKLLLTIHVTASVGWLGGVAAFLVLAVVGVAGGDSFAVRGSYFAMNLIGARLLVPLSVAALVTGIVQSLSTPWGLLRYYWILVKLGLTVSATVILVLHQYTAVAFAAHQASISTTSMTPDLREVGLQLIADSGLALVVLLTITTLSVYKPWGLTRFGRRKHRELRARTSA